MFSNSRQMLTWSKLPYRQMNLEAGCHATLPQHGPGQWSWEEPSAGRSDRVLRNDQSQICWRSESLTQSQHTEPTVQPRQHSTAQSHTNTSECIDRFVTGTSSVFLSVVLKQYEYQLAKSHAEMHAENQKLQTSNLTSMFPEIFRTLSHEYF